MAKQQEDVGTDVGTLIGHFVGWLIFLSPESFALSAMSVLAGRYWHDRGTTILAGTFGVVALLYALIAKRNYFALAASGLFFFALGLPPQASKDAWGLFVIGWAGIGVGGLVLNLGRRFVQARRVAEEEEDRQYAELEAAQGYIPQPTLPVRYWAAQDGLWLVGVYFISSAPECLVQHADGSFATYPPHHVQDLDVQCSEEVDVLYNNQRIPATVVQRDGGAVVVRYRDGRQEHLSVMRLVLRRPAPQ